MSTLERQLILPSPARIFRIFVEIIHRAAAVPDIAHVLKGPSHERSCSIDHKNPKTKKGGTLSDTALLKLLKQDVLIQRRPILQLGRCPDPWRRHCGQRVR